jgi:hypothetical protein
MSISTTIAIGQRSVRQRFVFGGYATGSRENELRRLSYAVMFVIGGAHDDDPRPRQDHGQVADQSLWSHAAQALAPNSQVRRTISGMITRIVACASLLLLTSCVGAQIRRGTNQVG